MEVDLWPFTSGLVVQQTYSFSCLLLNLSCVVLSVGQEIQRASVISNLPGLVRQNPAEAFRRVVPKVRVCSNFFKLRNKQLQFLWSEHVQLCDPGGLTWSRH